MGDIVVGQRGDQNVDDKLISLIPWEVVGVGNHGGSSRDSCWIHDQLGRMKNRAINEAIHILSAKVGKKLELPGHIVIFGQFYGRGVIHVRNIENRGLLGGTWISGNTRIGHWEETKEGKEEEHSFSLFVALIP
jgi:hypothetical protein